MRNLSGSRTNVGLVAVAIGAAIASPSCRTHDCWEARTCSCEVTGTCPADAQADSDAARYIEAGAAGSSSGADGAASEVARSGMAGTAELDDRRTGADAGVAGSGAGINDHEGGVGGGGASDGSVGEGGGGSGGAHASSGGHAPGDDGSNEASTDGGGAKGGGAGTRGTDGTGTCVKETDKAFCARLGMNCETVVDFDNCEGSRSADCGRCTAPEACGGSGVANVCGCTPESDAAFCARLGKNCGRVVATDNCGTTRTASCGDCGGSTPVCEANRCVARSSCKGLPTTCGRDGTDDCCASSVIPGGTFYRNYDGVTYTDQDHPATVSDFRLDTYEITVGRFRKFVAAYPTYRPAAGTGKNPHFATDPGWDAAWSSEMPADQGSLISGLKCSETTWTDRPDSNETRPMNCLPWYEAFAFCIWDGGRLPTSAEWDYAAAGGSEQRAYPWSTPPTSMTIDDSYAVYCGGSCMSPKNVGTTSAKGNAKWGHADMAGNVAEWVLDSSAVAQNPCNDCAATSGGFNRYYRGGSFASGPIPTTSTLASILTGYAEYGPATQAFTNIGARCARNP